MAEQRLLRLLLILSLAITTVSIVGHYMADAICLVIEASADIACAEVTQIDRTDATTSNLHTGFALPTILSTVAPAALVFLFIASNSTLVPYVPLPTPPPPKLASS
jgi:hypothetical protein